MVGWCPVAESFLSEDPIETYLSKRVEVMHDWDLISYLQQAMKALYGIEMRVEGKMEPAIMQCLQRTYGQAEAGRIVKWVVFRYFCRDSANPGQYVKFTSFAKGRRWWTDMMHAEMQDHALRESKPIVQSAATSVWL